MISLSDTKLETAIDIYIKHLVADYMKWAAGKVTIPISFAIEEGHKYIKVIDNTLGKRSAHSFIVRRNFKLSDGRTMFYGDVLKTASWNRPATNFIRGNVFNPISYQDRAKWTGVQ
jgi:hypothetical protein